jgi:hypothetical protein
MKCCPRSSAGVRADRRAGDRQWVSATRLLTKSGPRIFSNPYCMHRLLPDRVAMV